VIEMIVVLVVVSIIAAVTIRYVVSASQMYARFYCQSQADGEVLDALKRMRREIRPLKVVVTAGTNQLTFVSQSGATNTFQLSGRTVSLNGGTLAADVDIFSFKYYDFTNGVTTNLALIRRIGLDFRVTRHLAVEDLNVNFFLDDGILK